MDTARNHEDTIPREDKMRLVQYAHSIDEATSSPMPQTLLYK